LREFVRNPRQLGAVAPSGKALARRIVDAACIADHHVVAELGAGTGSMTSELVERDWRALIALEPNSCLAGMLRERFPTVVVEERLAQQLPEIVQEHGVGAIDRVVSSLPWAIWPDAVQNSCFDAIDSALSDEGRFVTFAYVHAQMLPAARRLRQRLEDRYAHVETTPVVWRNLPPAFVFVCEGPSSGN
jgi:phospholipid N-methyltransferase